MGCCQRRSHAERCGCKHGKCAQRRGSGIARGSRALSTPKQHFLPSSEPQPGEQQQEARARDSWRWAGSPNTNRASEVRGSIAGRKEGRPVPVSPGFGISRTRPQSQDSLAGAERRLETRTRSPEGFPTLVPPPSWPGEGGRQPGQKEGPAWSPVPGVRPGGSRTWRPLSRAAQGLLPDAGPLPRAWEEEALQAARGWEGRGTPTNLLPAAPAPVGRLDGPAPPQHQLPLLRILTLSRNQLLPFPECPAPQTATQ